MAQSPPSERSLRTFAGLQRLIALLRGPGGCPWDRVQTHASLRPYLLEEAFETLEALDAGDFDALKEELGDLLFEVLLQAQLAQESGAFQMSDVILGVASKLVRRHPHVFADSVAETPGAVIEQWDELKSKERAGKSALAGIPRGLPALAYAQAIQRRASKAGFAWESEQQAWDALTEELAELREATTEEDQRREAGDVLFATANLLRYFGADAEDALRQTCRSFSRQFKIVEDLAAERQVDLLTAELDAKLGLWEEAKTRSRST